MDPEDLPGWAATPASYSAPPTPIPGEEMEDGEAASVLANNKNMKHCLDEKVLKSPLGPLQITIQYILLANAESALKE